MKTFVKLFSDTERQNYLSADCADYSDLILDLLIIIDELITFNRNGYLPLRRGDTEKCTRHRFELV